MTTLKKQLILIGVLVLISPVVIFDFRLKSLIYPLLWLASPFFIYSLLPKKRTWVSVFFFLSLIAYLAVSLFLLLGLGLCAEHSKTYQYISKENRNVKLVARKFSCYGTTEDLVLYKEYAISKEIKIELHYKTFVDYQNVNIDSTVWEKLK